MWQRCAMVPLQPVPTKKSAQHHPPKARLHLLIHVHVPVHIHVHVGIPILTHTHTHVRPRIVHHLLLTPNHGEVICGNGSETQAQK